MRPAILVLLALLLSIQCGCGRIHVNRTLNAFTQESSWHPLPGAAPQQPLRYAIGQCFAEYLDHREFEALNAPLLFDAYEGCMNRNGFTRAESIPPYR